MPGPSTAEQLLLPGLLTGRRLLVVAPAEVRAGGGWAGAVSHACAGLGAAVDSLAPSRAEDEDDGAADVDVLVIDGAGLFAAAGEDDADGVAALRGCLDGAWSATRAVANAAFIPQPRSGRVLLLAPRPSAGPRARAAAAALENMARTLSVEWARHAITIVAIAPGDDTAGEQVGALVAFLASTAGDYYSGCLLDLRGV
jgi:NAD(P)-dependent dehydrogenase (short-subunit alcohol dehydrogenase family)